MIILHATKRYPNSIGGDGIVVASLERYQRKAGYMVHVLASNCADIVDAPQVHKFGLPIASDDIDTINVRRVVSLLGLFLSSFRFLSRMKPDIVHSHSVDIGFALSLACHMKGIPIVNTCHSVIFYKPGVSPAKQRLELSLLKWARFDKIITVDKNSVAAFAEHRIPHVIHIANAVDLSQFEIFNNRTMLGKPTFLFVGRMVADKGVPYLLEACKQLDSTISDWQLILVGDGADFGKYRNLVVTMNISDKVTFAGRQEQSAVLQYYATADIFVLPSLYEALPLVLLEAWAARLPVIITNEGNSSGICRDRENALVVPAASASKLAEAMKAMATDADLRAKLATAGRKEVEQFHNYACTAQHVEDIYTELLV